MDASAREHPSIRTPDEIARIGRACAIVHEVLDALARAAVPGVTTAELDRIAAEGARLGILAAPAQEGGGDIGYVTMLRDPDGHLVEFTFGQPLRGL